MATAKKKVWILDGGSLVIDRSQVLWHIDVGTPVRFPVYSVLIEHPDGLFMYDTGYDLDHVNLVLPFELPEQTPDQTIPAQLKACGFDPEQVSFVVNSHFHFDHVGGNKYLTGATTLVNTAELRHAKVPEPFEHLGYSDLSFDFPGHQVRAGVLESPHAEAFDFVVSLQSIPRRGVPADIAPAVAFLASEEAHWITGQMLTADGGHTRH